MSDTNEMRCKRFPFLIPEVLVDSAYRAVNRDEPPLMKGMEGSLKFVPWVGVKDIIACGIAAVEELPLDDEFLEEARGEFRSAHIKIAKLLRQHKDLKQMEASSMQREIEASENQMMYPDGGGDGSYPVSGNKRNFQEFEKPANSSTSLTGVHESVMSALESLVHGVCDRKTSEGYKEVLVMKTAKCSSEHMRPIDQGLSESAPPLAENNVPDKGLFQYLNLNSTRLRNSSRIPLCSYEFKGPSFNMFGKNLPSVSDWPSTGSGTDSLRNARPELNIYQGETAAEGHDVGAVSDDESFMYKDGQDASSLAAILQKVFDPRTDWDTIWKHIYKMKNENGENTDKITIPSHIQTARVVAQVLSQVLLTQTGCGLYYNHQSAIGFELRGIENGRVVVAVTGDMAPDVLPGNVSMLFGITKYCHDKLMKDGEEGMLVKHKEVRKMFRLISEATIRNLNRSNAALPGTPDDSAEECDDSDWAPPTSRNDCSAGSSESAEGGHFMILALNGNGREDRRGEKAHNTEGRSGTIVRNEAEAIVLSPMSGSDEPTHLENLLPGRAFRGLDTILRNMFMTNKGVLKTGSNSIVLDGEWKGRRVVVKMWCRDSLRSRLALRAEMQTYQHIQTYSPELLGRAVPEILLGWDSPKANSAYAGNIMVITEYVGCTISRGQGDLLMVVGSNGVASRIEPFEERDICAAAIESLQLLHDHSIIHGHVEYGSLRVERRNGTQNGWRAWWIDLSTSIISESYAAKAMDRADCVALFKNAF